MKKLSYLVLVLLLLMCVGLSGCSIVEINNTTDKSTYVTMNKKAEETTPFPNYQRGKSIKASYDMDILSLVLPVAPVVIVIGVAKMVIRALMTEYGPKKKYVIIDRIICIAAGILLVYLFGIFSFI